MLHFEHNRSEGFSLKREKLLFDENCCYDLNTIINKIR